MAGIVGSSSPAIVITFLSGTLDCATFHVIGLCQCEEGPCRILGTLRLSFMSIMLACRFLSVFPS